MDELPGPRGLPWVGNALGLSRDRIHQDVENLVRQHGSLFRLQMGRSRVLVVADHKLVAGVLRDRPERFRRSSRTELRVREMGLSAGIFTAEGQAWTNQRRMVMAGFAPGQVRAYFPLLLRVTRRLQSRWERAAREGAVIDLQADLMRFTVDAVAGLAFGTDVNTLGSEENIIQQHLDKICPALFKRIWAVVPYWRYLKLPADRALDRSVTQVKAAIDDFILQARTRLWDDPARAKQPPNLLEAMLVASEQPGSGVRQEDVAGNVLTLLLAGEDTTANTLAWMIYLLYKNPHALSCARQEVLRVTDGRQVPTAEHMNELNYLHACAQETMRLKPVSPFMPMQALRDTSVGDVSVPAGTLVWCVLRHQSVDARHFSNPTAFEPERWLAGDVATASAGAGKHACMPFGSGPRICPGRYLALVEIKMAMAMLLRHFDIEALSTLDGREPRELMSFTMSPEGLRMKLRERGLPPQV